MCDSNIDAVLIRVIVEKEVQNDGWDLFVVITISNRIALSVQEYNSSFYIDFFTFGSVLCVDGVCERVVGLVRIHFCD
jgi:hypothetical protein